MFLMIFQSIYFNFYQPLYYHIYNIFINANVTNVLYGLKEMEPVLCSIIKRVKFTIELQSHIGFQFNIAIPYILPMFYVYNFFLL